MRRNQKTGEAEETKKNKEKRTSRKSKKTNKNAIRDTAAMPSSAAAFPTDKSSRYPAALSLISRQSNLSRSQYKPLSQSASGLLMKQATKNPGQRTERG